MVAVAVPRVRLLGRPAVADAEGRLREFPPGLKGAAMGYLALQRRWVARDELLVLFWPDRPEVTARGNLRPLLARLAGEPLAAGFEREPSRVRWLVESDHQGLLVAHRERRWSDAWRLAGGELLEGVSMPRAPEYESWLDIERAVVREAVQAAGMQVADAALEAGEPHEASEVLAALHRLDPLDEAVVRRLMAALARRGARGDALATYDAHVERCLDELGVEPEAATVALAEAVRSGSERTEVERVPRHREAAAVTLPVPLTPFVGRAVELGQVVERLRDSDCRLITLVGPGGIGKSRLAVEAARVAAPHFRGGVRAADLAAVSSDGDVPAVVAEAVGIELERGSEGTASIARAVESRELLLVLDNVEHLPSVPALVSDLLGAAPGLRVLATSRSALGLVAEWRYEVPGLSYRGGGVTEGAGGRPTASAQVGGGAALSEAAEHFVAAGRRATTGFEPGAEERAVIEGIATSLAGSPLALELAAAWTRVLEVRAIAEELAHDLQLLTSDAPDRPPRHASIRSVLDQTWSMLQPRERTAMRRLAVFRGGFDLEAAREVAQVELPTLLALVNKSCLRRAADGRFTRHPLVWRDARERAKGHATEFEDARARHARYYLRLIGERRLANTHPEVGRLLREIQLDLENIAAAWRWAVAGGADALPLEAVGGLVGFRWARGWHGLIDALFREALAVAPAAGALRGLLVAAMGYADVWEGRGDFGLEQLREGMRLVEGQVDSVDAGWVNLGLGLALLRSGRHEEAASAFERGAACYREVGDAEAELIMWNNRAHVATTTSEALRLRFELKARASELDAIRVLDPLHGGIAWHLCLVGEFERAERTLRAGRAYLDDAAKVSFSAFHRRTFLAAIGLQRGRLRRAEAIACGTLHRPEFAAARDQFVDAVVSASALVGRVALVRGDLAAAESWSRRALDRHRANHGSEAAFDFALETLARGALTLGDDAAAARWLESVGRGPDPFWRLGPLAGRARRVRCACCEAEVALIRGQIALARKLTSEALASAGDAELVTATLAALVSAARVFRVGGDEQRAAALFDYVRAHPRAMFESRLAAARERDGDGRDLADALDDGVAGVHGVASEVIEALVAAAGRGDG